MAIDVRKRLEQKWKENEKKEKINVAERLAQLQAQNSIPIKFTDGVVRNVPQSAFDKIRRETATPSPQKVMRDFAFAKDFASQMQSAKGKVQNEKDRRDAAVRNNYAERIQEERDAKYADYDIKGAEERLNNSDYWMQRVVENRKAGRGFAGDNAIAAERDALEKEIANARAAKERNRVRSFARIPQNADFEQYSTGGFYGSYDPRTANPARYGEMTDEEVKVWRYLKNAKGKMQNTEVPSAEEYLQSLEDELTQRRGVKMGVKARTIDNPIGRGAAALGLAALSGIKSPIEGTVAAITGEETEPGVLDYAAGYVRNDIDGALGVAYDLTQSTANMVPSILLGSLTGVPVLGTASMGVSAAGNAYSDALRDGYSKGQARLYGGIIGASEAALQNILGGIGALGGKRSVSNVLKKLVKKIPKAGLRAAVKLAGSEASEFSEEALQTYIEAGLRNVIFDENFNLRDVSEDALYSGMLGALSAGVFEAPGVVAQEVQNAKDKMQNESSTEKDSALAGASASLRFDSASGSAQNDTGAERMQSAKGKMQSDGDSSAEASGDAGAESGNVIRYTPEEADGIRKDSQTFRNVIEGIDITLGEFFSKWKKGRKNGEKLEKLYLGKASESVKRQISDLLGYEIPNRDFIITNDGVKHVFDEHGDVQKEEEMGQVVVNEETIATLVEALNNPDSITKEFRKKEPRIVFRKKTNAGDVIAVEVDNKGRATLSLKTVYIKKGQESTQRGDFPGETQANLLTSETTVPNPPDDVTIPQTPEKSNRQNTAEGDSSAEPQNDTGAERMQSAKGKMQSDGDSSAEASGDAGAESGNVKGSVRADTEAQRGEVIRDDNFKRAKLKSREVRVLDALAKITGTRIRFVEQINGGDDNAQYSNGEIQIALDSKDPVRVALTHEVVHRLREISPESFKKLSDFVFDNLTEDELEVLKEDFGIDYGELSEDGRDEEIVAQAFGVIMGDGNRLDALIESDRTTWEKICDIINDLIISIRRALSGTREAQISEYDREAFSGLLAKAEEMEKVLREALDAAGMQSAKGKMQSDEDSSAEPQNDTRNELSAQGDLAPVKRSVKRLRDGRKYVQADRQVIFGNAPESWSEQLEDYINGKIRRGKNVELITEDGEVLTLTADTAGKVSSMFNNDGTTMSEAAFERKVNAGSHIDELAQVSIGNGKVKKDSGQKHGEKASGGWNYRTAYFKDFDGKYYQCTISVMTGTDGNAVYNIGKIQERSFPGVSGSSAANSGARVETSITNGDQDSGSSVNNGGALSGKTSFDNSISDSEGNVNTKSSRRRNEEARERVYELERENKKQKKLIEQLRDRMKNMSPNRVPGAVDAKAVRKATRELIRRYGGTLNANKLAPKLQELWDGIGTGKSLNWEDIHAKTESIAREIAESAVERDDTMYQTYAELRRYCRENTFTISESDRSNIPDFNDFRKRNMGRMNIAYGKTDVDRHYKLLCELFPGEFNEDEISHPADQLEHIAEVLGDVYDIVERNPFASHMDYAVGMIANDILETFYDIPESKKTLKDLKIERLERTVLERDARIKKVEKELEQYQKQTEKVLEDYNRKEHELYEEKEAFRESKDTFWEKQREREMRARIVRSTNRLSQKLRWATDKKHIPGELQGAVARFLECVNLTGLYTYDEKGKLRKSPDGTPTQKSLNFTELKAIYKKFDGELVFAPEFFEGVYEDGEVRGDILSKVYDLRDVRVAEMTKEQLGIISKGLKIVETAVKSADTMFSSSRFREISALAENIRDNAPVRDKFKVRRIASSVRQLFDIENLTPEAFFHRLGEGGDEIFRMLSNAEGRKTEIAKETKVFTNELIDGKSRRAWEREVKTVTLGGEEVEMSVAQIMELYALSRRKQAEAHLLEGGITPEGIPGHKGEKRRSPIKNVTAIEIGKAVELLTPEQRKITEKLSEFASKTLADYMNEACLKVFGYKKFGEEKYWTIRVDPTTVHRQADTADAEKATPTIRNYGMAKATTHGANNALLVGSIFDTFADHAAQAETYAAYLEVTEDMRRLINYSFRDGEGKGIEGMQNVLDGVFGITERKDAEGKKRDEHPGIKYWNKLYEDINGGMRPKDGGTPFDRYFRNSKVASVAANLRVVIQQPTAILRAGAEIDYKYLTAGMVHPERGWERALKYAPIAQQKDWGRADIGTGRAMKELLFGSDGMISKIQDKSMILASGADAWAWGSLWSACELEIRAENKELKVGSKEFFNAVAERFTEIVNKTQVVDGVLQRSQNMRSQNALAKMATAFMSEPTKQYNMLASAVYDASHGKTKEERSRAKKKLARTGISLILSGVTNAAMQSIIDAIRDDDREKNYWEKWFDAFTGKPGEDDDTLAKKFMAIMNGNVGSAANPIGYFPYAKDLWSLLQGYDVERMDVESIADFVQSAGGALYSLTGEGSNTAVSGINELIAAGATLFGIPYASLKRDVGTIARSVVQWIGNPVLDYYTTKVTTNIKHERNADIFYDILFSAKEKDKESYDIIYADMIKSGMKKEDIDREISTYTSGKFDSALSAAEKAKKKEDATLTDKIIYRHLNREKNMTRDVRAGDEETVLRNLDKYRESVEKYLEKYPGSDEEKKMEYAYREANRELYGEKYAIRANGGNDVYKKAEEKVRRGKTTWEEYYDKYFGKTERRYEAIYKREGISYAEFEKIADIMSKQETKEEKIAAMVKLGYKRSEARRIYSAYNDAE